MLVDPKVSRRKFEREVATLQGQSRLLAQRGCLVLGLEYPFVDILVLPERSLRVSFPTAKTSSIVIVGPGTAVASVEFAMLMTRPFIARISLDDFDLCAPSVRFLDVRSRKDLTAQEIVPGNLMAEDGRVQQVVLADHPVHHRSFLCVRGVREYHDHPQHTGDDWFLYRGRIGLFDIVDLIWRTCVATFRAHLVIQPSAMQLRFEYDLKT